MCTQRASISYVTVDGSAPSSIMTLQSYTSTLFDGFVSNYIWHTVPWLNVLYTLFNLSKRMFQKSHHQDVSLPPYQENFEPAQCPWEYGGNSPPKKKRCSNGVARLRFKTAFHPVYHSRPGSLWGARCRPVIFLHFVWLYWQQQKKRSL